MVRKKLIKHLIILGGIGGWSLLEYLNWSKNRKAQGKKQIQKDLKEGRMAVSNLQASLSSLFKSFSDAQPEINDLMEKVDEYAQNLSSFSDKVNKEWRFAKKANFQHFDFNTMV